MLVERSGNGSGSIDGRVRANPGTLTSERLPRYCTTLTSSRIPDTTTVREDRWRGLRSMQVSTSFKVPIPHQSRHAKMSSSAFAFPSSKRRRKIP
jgi:hypothetical protein